MQIPELYETKTIPDKKLTDNEIVKAFECCMNWHDKKDCAKCPMDESKNLCITELRKLSFDLINRLQEENERLQDRIDRYNVQVANQREMIEKYEPIKEILCTLWETMSSIGVVKGKEKPTLEELAEAIDQIKTSAYKEFAERLESIMYEKYQKYDEQPYPIATISIIDNLLKEMTGEQNA